MIVLHVLFPSFLIFRLEHVIQTALLLLRQGLSLLLVGFALLSLSLGPIRPQHISFLLVKILVLQSHLLGFQSFDLLLHILVDFVFDSFVGDQ